LKKKQKKKKKKEKKKKKKQKKKKQKKKKQKKQKKNKKKKQKKKTLCTTAQNIILARLKVSRVWRDIKLNVFDGQLPSF
jgi:hypothetical protein